MDLKKYLTNRNVALLGTITFHVVLFAIFTHVNLKVNKPEHNMDLVINFIEQQDVEEIVEEEKVAEEKDNLLEEFGGPVSNQASSRSNEKSIEDLRKSMKSLEGVRNEETDLFSDKAAARNIPTGNVSDKNESNQGKGDAERKSENAYTGKSTINYYLKNRYSTKLDNPIYTCITGGLVYINIKVDQNGRVTDASYNSSKSKTKNECLIETALKYARRSRFNSDYRASEIQKGYISYNFPKK